MGKKSRIKNYPQKFGRKHANHPVAKVSNPITAVVEVVIDAVEAVAEALVDPVISEPAEKAPMVRPRTTKTKRTKKSKKKET